MKWCVIFVCLYFLACDHKPGDSSITNDTSDTKLVAETTVMDTSSSFAKDASPSPPVTPAIKKPSGIYQFLYTDENDEKILHTVAFYPSTFRLEEEYPGKKDSVVVTQGTWAPSQGFIWLYKEQLVRARYAWKGDSLQYFSPRLNKRFSMQKLTLASANPVWQKMKKGGAVLYGVGTEPFWSVEVKKQDSIIVTMPDWTAPLRAKITGTTHQNKNTIYRAAADSLEVVVSPYFCNDGMSDFIYSNKITISYKRRAFEGCGVLF